MTERRCLSDDERKALERLRDMVGATWDWRNASDECLSDVWTAAQIALRDYPVQPEAKLAGVVFEIGQDDDADLPGMRYCTIIIDGEELTGWVNADAFLDFKELYEKGGG